MWALPPPLRTLLPPPPPVSAPLPPPPLPLLPPPPPLNSVFATRLALSAPPLRSYISVATLKRSCASLAIAASRCSRSLACCPANWHTAWLRRFSSSFSLSASIFALISPPISRATSSESPAPADLNALNTELPTYSIARTGAFTGEGAETSSPVPFSSSAPPESSSKAKAPLPTESAASMPIRMPEKSPSASAPSKPAAAAPPAPPSNCESA
mmetsp:Transcript_29198/g.63970  ORF Transcript_29198/g.63970 Transcript_29198/m.63970 type:complete len:213 (-) Transcript_29198:547-1185(-)